MDVREGAKANLSSSSAKRYYLIKKSIPIPERGILLLLRTEPEDTTYNR